MVETRHLRRACSSRTAGDRKSSSARPRKIVPEYHPTQLVPEEDRPRQDFEKPVETETPEPTPRAGARSSASRREQEPLAAEPQPVPVPEQQPTTEPNVVRRQRPNEAAPRQADAASQAQPAGRSRREVKISQLVDAAAANRRSRQPASRQGRRTLASRPADKPSRRRRASARSRADNDQPKPHAATCPPDRATIADAGNLRHADAEAAKSPRPRPLRARRSPRPKRRRPPKKPRRRK